MDNQGAINDKNEKLYSPFNGFDGPEHRLKLKPTSKYYVRDVCDVQAKRMTLSDQVRCQYADQAGYKRVEWQEMTGGKRRPVFELEDVYDEYHVHAAMAEAQFYNCPKLLEVVEREEEYTEQQTGPDGETETVKKTRTIYDIEIVNEELFGALDEGVVNLAFLAFSAERSGIRSAPQPSSNSAGIARHGIRPGLN